jgi:carbonic anhydrase/acetyltransferase-like protein (isoleucine patch superfamily)
MNMASAIDGAGSDDRSKNAAMIDLRTSLSFGAAMAAVWIHVETELSHHAQYHAACRLASTCLMIVGASCMIHRATYDVISLLILEHCCSINKYCKIMKVKQDQLGSLRIT